MKYTAAILAAVFSVANAQQFQPISDAGEYSALLDAVVATGSGFTLVSAAPVTIFGPKDSAFTAIQDFFDNLSVEELSSILLDHVVVGTAVNAAAIVEAGCIEAQSAGGLMLGILFNPDDSTVTVNGIPVTTVDIAGDYGILHGIESVLIPGEQGDFVPCPVFAADFTPIADKGIYSTLLGAVVSTENDAVISQNVPVTIFGPNDDAFAAIQDTVDSLSTEALSGVLLNHVVVGAAVESSAVVEAGCMEAVAAGGMNLAIRYNTTTQVADVNGIVINDFDVTGEYGVFHGIASVITSSYGYVACPVLSVVEQVAANGNYSTLLGFLDNPLLQGQLENVGPITIFGPNDAAFAAVSSDLDGIHQVTLLQTLAGHIVAGVHTVADVKAQGCVLLDTILGTKVRAMYVEDDHGDNFRRRLAGHEMPTDLCCRRRLVGHEMPADPCCERRLSGHEMVDDSSMGHIMINDAMVILADIEDGTSIFHGLDKVLLLGGDTFECPTDAPVASPTAAPAPTRDDETADEGSSAGPTTAPTRDDDTADGGSSAAPTTAPTRDDDTADGGSSAGPTTTPAGDDDTADEGSSAGPTTAPAGDDETADEGSSAGPTTTPTRDDETADEGSSAGPTTAPTIDDGAADEGSSAGPTTAPAGDDGAADEGSNAAGRTTARANDKGAVDKGSSAGPTTAVLVAVVAICFFVFLAAFSVYKIIRSE
ncbi:unnamed protein product [Cylindrotheca closterium]|uniref:FAS1 domain-containing protein n=1 Tax=Cylindrotheca closterium TaxID=2856 RepID=A0AAD2FJ62_9STRA|nr:unnamed protein product [Cylindrotheca closterium]